MLPYMAYMDPMGNGYYPIKYMINGDLEHHLEGPS
jgi:hypothetical protein